MKSIKVCEYSRSRSFDYDLILQDQASGERSQDQWSSGFSIEHFTASTGYTVLLCFIYKLLSLSFIKLISIQRF